MPLFNWTDAYAVNIMIIDNQHKQLVDMINGLHEAMRTGKGNEVLGEMVNGLAKYALHHFTQEEKYMTQHAYPGLAAHKVEHEAFKKKVGEIQKKMGEQKFGLTMEVMNFLKDWLVKHILEVDKKYAPFLNERGVR
jgi:hemerythrin